MSQKDENGWSLKFRRWLVEHWDGREINDAVNGFQKYIGKEVYWLRPLHESFEQSHEKVIGSFGNRETWLNFWGDYRRLPHENIQMDLIKDVEMFSDLLSDNGINYLYFSNCFNTEAGLVKWGKSTLKEKFKTLLRRIEETPVIVDGTDVDHHYPQPNWLEEVKKNTTFNNYFVISV